MTRRPSSTALLRRAIANGATIETDTPAPQAKQPRADGDKLNRLAKAAARGWRSIESCDSVRYRWRAAGGYVTDWMTYEQATAYAAATDAPQEDSR